MADIDLQKLSIPKFYAGRHIFITGGSGFIGKVLVEKLLRSCPDVAGLHLLLREKKGVPPADRIKTITQVPLFQVLRKANPNFEDKLHVIKGDISMSGLGISPEDRKFLVKNVSVVFHVAATVRFNEPLTRAVALNVRATRDMALMAKEMPNLAAFVHVSTTYCNTDKRIIEEKLYSPYVNWRTLLDATEKLDSRTIAMVTPKILNNLPNTYTFTKNLAEHCLHEILEGKPHVIVRPSIVISTVSDPIDGWIDNFQGPVGLLVACGKGLVHITLTPTDNIADYMPVDLVVKVLLIAAFKHGSTKTVGKSADVYNCSSAEVKPLTMGRLRQLGHESNAIYPLNNMLWVPFGLMTSNRTVLLLGTLVLHMIPAFFLDSVLRLRGKKPRLMKLQRSIYTAQIALGPFLVGYWVFKNEKALSLDRDVPAQDRDAFSFDFTDEDVTEYFRRMTLGGRRYLLKESDDTLPAAKIHRQRMIIINYVVMFLLGVMLFGWVVLPLLSSLPRLLNFSETTMKPM